MRGSRNINRKPLGEMLHPGETLIASNPSKYKRSDKSCDEKNFQQGKFHEMLPMRHIGSHHMHLNEFHAEHCYYFKARISLSEFKLVDVEHNRKEFTNVTCMLSTAVRGNVRNSATVYVEEADLVSAVKQTAAAFRTSTGFLNEAYMGITALVDGDMSSHLTLQILQSIILRTLKDEAQSQTSSNMSITSECRPRKVDHPGSSDFSVSTVKASSANPSSTVMNTLSRRARTSVCQQQFATFTPQIPLHFSAPKTGQKLDKSTATLQAREQHTPLSPVQAVLLIPVEISDPSPASKARPSDTRKRQQKPALSLLKFPRHRKKQTLFYRFLLNFHCFRHHWGMFR